MIPQVARPGPAIMPLVVFLARLAATVTVDRWAFTDLAMSRLHLSVPVVFLLAHHLGAFGLMSPIVALAGDAPACIGAHLVAAWVDALARRVWLAKLPIDWSLYAVPEMEGVAGEAAICCIGSALLAVGTLLAGYSHAGPARFAKLAHIAVTGFAETFDESLGFLPAGWIAAMCWLWRLDQ